MTHYRTDGFTFLELLITLSIVAILLIAAVPGFRSTVQRNSIATTTDRWISAVNFARGEAVQRNLSVSLCPAANAESVTCSQSANWSKYWIVFIDPNANGTLTSSEQRLDVYEVTDKNLTFTTSIGQVTFSNLGQASSGAGTFEIKAPDCIGQNGKLITLLSSGVVHVTNSSCS